MLHYVTVGPEFTRVPADEPTRSWVLDAADEEAARSQAAAVYRCLHPDVGSLRVRSTPEVDVPGRSRAATGGPLLSN